MIRVACSWRPLCLLAAVLLLAGCRGTPRETLPAKSTSYDDSRRALQGVPRRSPSPNVKDGVPDYTTAAMSAQLARLQPLQRRLDAIDSTAWPIAQRVDYLLVKAEMRGLDFQHRMVRPWRRDPAFYSTTSLGFGPKIYDAIAIPRLPLPPDRLERFRVKLKAVPAVFAQAKGNLTEPAPDLARLAIGQKTIERNFYEQLAVDLGTHHPDLVEDARAGLGRGRGFPSLARRAAAIAEGPAPASAARTTTGTCKHVLLFP